MSKGVWLGESFSFLLLGDEKNLKPRWKGEAQ